MPTRIPAPGKLEAAAFLGAGFGAFAPFYLLAPGAEARLASQTTKWAPSWERNISHFAPPARSIAQRVEPRVGKTMEKLDDRFHPRVEKIARSLDRRIKYGVDKSFHK